MNPNSPYASLVAELREIGLLKSVSDVLHWDEQTQMPPKGAAHRGEQVALLAKLLHARLTSPRFGDLLEAATQSLPRDGDSDEVANVRETRRAYDRARK